MTDSQREQIRRLREEGHSYTKVARLLNIPENTVKTYCKRNGLNGYAQKKEKSEGAKRGFCKCCGAPVMQNPGRKEKKFCSSYCRNKWWNAHLELVNRKANYNLECQYCHKMFTAYGNAKRKYCCHACYIKDRFGESAMSWNVSVNDEHYDEMWS